MKWARNHEGYHDPTACEAIMRARSSKQTAKTWRRKKEKITHLTFLLSEAHGFVEAVKLLRE